MAIKKTYIYANGEILAQHNGDYTYPRYFYLHDRLGSVRLVVNESGTAQNSYTYNPFGELFTSETAENVSNPFRFTGQFFDDEIGQYYLRARMYDPALMRFTSRDPVKGKFRKPMTLHKYLYCNNDPINRIDPSGKQSAAEILALPVTAGYATHALAIAFVAYGVMHDTDYAINLGIAIEQSIIGVMTLVSTGVDYWDALVHAVKQKDRDDFGKLREIGKDYGKTLEEVRDAIERNKKYYRPGGGGGDNLTEEEIREILENEY
jgi:RHS repeat-associated protein